VPDPPVIKFPNVLQSSNYDFDLDLTDLESVAEFIEDFPNFSLDAINQALKNIDKDLKEVEKYLVDVLESFEGFNDRASSLRYYAPDNETIILYQQSNHEGEQFILTGTGKTVEIQKLSEMPDDDGDANDRIRSVKFSEGDTYKLPDIEIYDWSIVSPDPDNPFILHNAQTSTPTFDASLGNGKPTTVLVRLVASDTNENVGDVTTKVIVKNVAPGNVVLTLDSAVTDENSTITLSGSFSDPGTLDLHTVEIDWGDGSSETMDISIGDRTFSIFHQFLDDNPTGTPVDDYTVSVYIIDDDGGKSNSEEIIVTVNNLNPVAAIDSMTDEEGKEIGTDVPFALAGFMVNLAGSFTDAGTLDTHIAVIDWGDSASTDLGAVTAVTNASHVYLVSGDYTITQTIIDDDTGIHEPNVSITVLGTAEIISMMIDELLPFANDSDIVEALDKLRGDNSGIEENGAQDMLESDRLNAALEMIKQALLALDKTEADYPSSISKLLALAAKSSARLEIIKAEAAASSSKMLRKVQKAKSLLLQGDILMNALDFAGAVNKYQRAVRAL
jgi:hypothetical protein